MIHVIRQLPHLTALLAAAVIVLQFAAVEHSIEHGGTLPDIGCESCVSGAGHASLSTHSEAPHPAQSFTELSPYSPAGSPLAARRALPPARGPPLLA